MTPLDEITTLEHFHQHLDFGFQLISTSPQHTPSQFRKMRSTQERNKRRKKMEMMISYFGIQEIPKLRGGRRGNGA